MNERFILSGGGEKNARLLTAKAPQVIEGRLPAVQALEAAVCAANPALDKAETHKQGVGHSSVRRFIEGQTNTLVWGGFRLDQLQESK